MGDDLSQMWWPGAAYEVWNMKNTITWSCYRSLMKKAVSKSLHVVEYAHSFCLYCNVALPRLLRRSGS